MLLSFPARAAAALTARMERKRFSGEREELSAVKTDVAEQRKAEALKDAVYRISLAANGAEDMQKLFYEIDMIVGTLLSADVFTIALFSSATNRVSYQYYRNITNLHRQPSATENRLIHHVLSTGVSFIAVPESVNTAKGDTPIGELLTRDWLGVPLRAKGVTFGVIAIQNQGGTRYGEEERNILEFVSTQIAMSINRKRAENDLRASEEKFSKIFSSNPYPLMLVSFEDGTISDVNESMLQTTGYERNEMIGRSVMELDLICNEEDRRRLRQIVRTEGAIRNAECWFRKKSGILGLAMLSAEIVSFNGKTSILSVAKDIAEQKQAEDRIKSSLHEKEVLLREVHHRVKNNLQVVSSLLNLQSRSVTDERMLEFLKESRSRVKSMAMIHEMLYQSADLSHVDFADYLRNLALSLMRTYGGGDVALDVHVGDVQLGIDTAIPCGLIVNELITNSLKYAFTESGTDVPRRNCITVTMEETPAGDLLLAVGDNGIGIPVGVNVDTSATLGLRLVGILTTQINGTLILDRSSGTTFRILFPGG